MKDIDPLLEIRAWRDEFARLHEYDVKRISAAIHESASRFADRFVFVDPASPPGTERVIAETTPPSKPMISDTLEVSAL
jgi:hypothetical protein